MARGNALRGQHRSVSLRRSVDLDLLHANDYDHTHDHLSLSHRRGPWTTQADVASS